MVESTLGMIHTTHKNGDFGDGLSHDFIRLTVGHNRCSLIPACQAVQLPCGGAFSDVLSPDLARAFLGNEENEGLSSFVQSIHGLARDSVPVSRMVTFIVLRLQEVFMSSAQSFLLLGGTPI